MIHSLGLSFYKLVFHYYFRLSFCHVLCTKSEIFKGPVVLSGVVLVFLLYYFLAGFHLVECMKFLSIRIWAQYLLRRKQNRSSRFLLPSPQSRHLIKVNLFGYQPYWHCPVIAPGCVYIVDKTGETFPPYLKTYFYRCPKSCAN